MKASGDGRQGLRLVVLKLILPYVRLVVADLRDVSADQLLSNPLFDTFDTIVYIVILSAFLILVTAISVAVSWFTAGIRSASFLVFGLLTFGGLGLLTGVLAILMAVGKAAKRSEPEQVSETLEHAGYQEQRLRRERERTEEKLFQLNLTDTFVLQTLEMTGVRVFNDDVIWQFAPRVNVLLGKNGYGKTLLLKCFPKISSDF